VKVMPFRELEAESMEEAPKEYIPIILNASKYLVPVIAALLLFLFIVRPLLKSTGLTFVKDAVFCCRKYRRSCNTGKFHATEGTPA